LLDAQHEAVVLVLPHGGHRAGQRARKANGHIGICGVNGQCANTCEGGFEGKFDVHH
jgi:hypothetical protein